MASQKKNISRGPKPGKANRPGDKSWKERDRIIRNRQDKDDEYVQKWWEIHGPGRGSR